MVILSANIGIILTPAATPNGIRTAICGSAQGIAMSITPETPETAGIHAMQETEEVPETPEVPKDIPTEHDKLS